MKSIQEVFSSQWNKSFRPLDKEANLKLLFRFPLVKEFAKKHPHIKKDVYLRSYSRLHQFVVERSHCQRCPGLENCPNMMKGHYPELNEYGGGYIDLSMHACSLLKNKLEEQKRQSLIRSHHIPKEIRAATFESIDINPEREQAIHCAIDFCMEFASGKSPEKGLYFYGPFGVGKSYIAGAITNLLANNDIPSLMVHFPTLVEEMKSAVSNQENISDKIDALKTPPVLILDDIGAESLSPWIRDDVLMVILQYRMTEKLPTIYTSNMNLEELEEHFSQTSKGGWDPLKGKRLIERIRPYVEVILVEGKNRRYL